MSRLILVRHGEAAASWSEDPDPGLSLAGHQQAAAVAEALAARWPEPLPIVVSPLRRTRETAAALERRWGAPARVEPAVGEIPTPEATLKERAGWLHLLLQSTWDQAEAFVQEWRRQVLDALHAIPTDSVVVTHFVVVNLAVGAAGGDLRVRAFSPAYCSETVIETSGDGIEVVQLGAEATTMVR